MEETINYTLGCSNEVCGTVDYMPGNKEYLAVTLCDSKWFKTLRGAERWMEKRGYRKM